MSNNAKQVQTIGNEKSVGAHGADTIRTRRILQRGRERKS